MSLTAHLNNPQSPVRMFLYEQFPDVQRVVAPLRAQLAAAPTIRPSAPVAWHTVGTALDYRIRYYFAVTPPKKLVALDGALLASRTRLAPGLAFSFFFSELPDVMGEINPAGRRLEPAQEERLARYCYVLALFEEVFRAGAGIQSPLWSPVAKTTVGELLAIPAPHSIQDLCELSWGFWEMFNSRLGRPASMNPTFDGSRHVGGADADLILDDCLVDIKTTVKSRVDRRWLYQLLGYVLLDYTDRYQIQAVALYMSRQRVLFQWPLGQLLDTMAGARALPLPELRARFQEVASEALEVARKARLARAMLRPDHYLAAALAEWSDEDLADAIGADPARVWRLRVRGWPRVDQWDTDTQRLAKLVTSDVGLLRTWLRKLGEPPRA